jgi:hypothetical protein
MKMENKRNKPKLFSELTKEEKSRAIKKNYNVLIHRILDWKIATKEWKNFLSEEAKILGVNDPQIHISGDLSVDFFIKGSPGGPIQLVNTLIKNEMDIEKLKLLRKAKKDLEVLLSLKKEGQKFEIEWVYESLSTHKLFSSLMKIDDSDIKIIKEYTQNEIILKEIRKKEMFDIYSETNYLLYENIVSTFMNDMEEELHEFFWYLSRKIKGLLKEFKERIDLFASSENLREVLSERKDIFFYSNGEYTMDKYKR